MFTAPYHLNSLIYLNFKFIQCEAQHFIIRKIGSEENYVLWGILFLYWTTTTKKWSKESNLLTLDLYPNQQAAWPGVETGCFPPWFSTGSKDAHSLALVMGIASYLEL